MGGEVGRMEDWAVHGPARAGTGDRVRRAHVGGGGGPFFGVGGDRRLANFARVKLDRRGLGRRVYWAGDYLSAPGFEAATGSGARAADALLSDLGEPSESESRR